MTFKIFLFGEKILQYILALFFVQFLILETELCKALVQSMAI